MANDTDTDDVVMPDDIPAEQLAGAGREREPLPDDIVMPEGVPLENEPVPERKGFLGRSWDFLTDQTPQEYEGVGEIGNTPMPLGKGLGLGAHNFVSADPAARMNAVASRFPEAEFQQDRYGHPMVNIPGRTEGWTYMNNPGISLQDIADVPSQLLQFTGAAKAAGGGRFLLSRMAKMAAAEGGLSMGQDVASNLMGGRKSAAPDFMKAGMASIFGFGGEALGSIAGYGWRLMRDRTFFRNGRWTPKGREQLTRLGLNPDDMSPEVLQSLRKQFQRTGAGGIVAQTPESAQQARRVAQGENLPVPVTQTRGQVRQDPQMGAVEDEMLKGVRGESAQQMAATARSARSDQMTQNVGAIQSRIGKGSAARTRGEGAAAAQNRLASMREKEFEAANRTFDDLAEGAAAAEKTGKLRAWMQADDVSDVAAHIRDRVETFHDLADDATMQSLLKRIDDMGSGKKGRDLVGLDDLYRWRRQVNEAAKASGPKGTAAGRARRAFDDAMRKAQIEDLAHGDKSVIDAWKAANKKWHTAKKTWGQGDLVDALTTPISGRSGGSVLRMEPDEAANVLLRGREAGIPNNLYSRDVEKIRNLLGPDSPEWNALREEIFMNIARPGTKGLRSGEQTIFNGTAFAKEWDKAKELHRGLIENIFTAEERRMVDDFAQVAQRVTSPVPGAVNYSNTGISMQRRGLQGKWRELTDFLGMGKKAAVLGGAFGPVDRVWNSSAAQRAMRGRMETPAVSHPFTAGGSAAAGAGLEEQY